MASPAKNVVFDVVGTCVSYDNYMDAIESRLGDRMRAQNIGPKLFGYTWIEATEREYTYLSISGKYVKFLDIFRSIFYRTLWLGGIEEPRKFANDEDLDVLVQSYWGLKPRPGLAECFSKLREAGFTVWALTAGSTDRVSGYFKAAGIDMPAENFVSCDSIGIGKPSPQCYTYIKDKFTPDADNWFAAAHMWDSSAARCNGFKGAWAAVWEKEPCLDIFGEMEVVADTLPAMAEGIIAYSKK